MRKAVFSGNHLGFAPVGTLLRIAPAADLATQPDGPDSSLFQMRRPRTPEMSCSTESGQIPFHVETPELYAAPGSGRLDSRGSRRVGAPTRSLPLPSPTRGEDEEKIG